ncbi:hypothetical protein ACWEDZ_38180 [Streptomyces sp. NPDC005047]
MLLPALMIIAVLLLGAFFGELRRPGSSRQQRLCLRNRIAVTAGAVAFVLTMRAGWFIAKSGVLLSAVFVGLLVAFIADRLNKAETPSRETGQ